VGICISAQDATVRNNRADGTGNGMTLVDAFRRGIEPLPDRARVYNNTLYRGDSGALTACIIEAGSGSRVFNNLVSNPAGTAVPYVANVAVTAGNNLSLASPGFVGTDPYAASFLQLAPASPAIDKGAAVPVYDDCASLPRPVDGDGTGGAQYDVGASEMRQ
jgi:hypothetical protein